MEESTPGTEVLLFRIATARSIRNASTSIPLARFRYRYSPEATNLSGWQFLIVIALVIVIFSLSTIFD